MPTVHDLGKLVKAKYPGSYDDMGDGVLGAKIKAKYPGSYDDFADSVASLARPDTTAHADVLPRPPETPAGSPKGLLRTAGEGALHMVTDAAGAGARTLEGMGMLSPGAAKSAMTEEEQRTGVMTPQRTMTDLGILASYPAGGVVGGVVGKVAGPVIGGAAGGYAAGLTAESVANVGRPKEERINPFVAAGPWAVGGAAFGAAGAPMEALRGPRAAARPRPSLRDLVGEDATKPPAPQRVVKLTPGTVSQGGYGDAAPLRPLPLRQGPRAVGALTGTPGTRPPLPRRQVFTEGTVPAGRTLAPTDPAPPTSTGEQAGGTRSYFGQNEHELEMADRFAGRPLRRDVGRGANWSRPDDDPFMQRTPDEPPPLGPQGPQGQLPPAQNLLPGDRVTYTHHGYEGGAESSSPAVVTSVGDKTVKIQVKKADGEVVPRTVKKETLTPSPPEGSAAPPAAPQDSGPVGGNSDYTVVNTGTGKMPFRVVDTATGKPVRNEAGPAARRFASAEDAQAHAAELTAAKRDARRGMGGALRSGLDPREVVDAMGEVYGGVLRNAHDHLRRLGDIGHAVSNELHAMQLTRGVKAGELRLPLVEAGLHHPNDFKEVSPYVEMLRDKKITLAQVPEDLRPQAEVIAGVYSEVGRQRGSGGQHVLDNYFRHQHMMNDLRKSAAEREDMIQAEVHTRGHFGSEDEARTMMQSAFDLIDNRPGGERFLEWVKQRNPDWSEKDILGEIQRQWRDPKGTMTEGQRKARVLDLPFYDWNQGRVIPRYIDAQAKLLTEVEHLGAPMGDPSNFIEKARKKLAQPDIASFDTNVQDIWGAHPSGWPEETRKAVNLGSDAASLVIGPMATVKNYGQGVVGTLARTRNPLATAKIVAESSLPFVNRGAQRRALRNSSIDPEFQMETGQERGLAGPGFRKSALRFYHTPLRWSEVAGGVMGNEAGLYVADRAATNLVRDPSHAGARAVLARAGVNPDAVVERGGLLPQERSRVGLLTRYDVMGRNLPGETPVWMRHPLMKVFPATKFLTYPYLQTRQNLDLMAGTLQREGPMAALTGTGLLLGGNYLAGMGVGATRNALSRAVGGDPGAQDTSPLRVIRDSPANALGVDQVLDMYQGVRHGVPGLWAYGKEFPTAGLRGAWETLTPGQQASMMPTGYLRDYWRMHTALPPGAPPRPRRPKAPRPPEPPGR